MSETIGQIYRRLNMILPICAVMGCENRAEHLESIEEPILPFEVLYLICSIHYKLLQEFRDY